MNEIDEWGEKLNTVENTIRRRLLGRQITVNRTEIKRSETFDRKFGEMNLYAGVKTSRNYKYLLI